MNIYEIDAAILALVDENGEITDLDALDALTMERDKKVENVACWIKDLTAEAKAIREEELALAARRQSAEKQAERLKEYLGRVLNGAKFSTARCNVGYRTSMATVIDDEEAALKWVQEHSCSDCYTTKVSLVKSGVGALLKNNIEVPGARLERRQNVQVR